MDYAEVIVQFGDAVDAAVDRAMKDGDLSHREIADELRRIAEEWEAAA